jgi:hypothetical protein
VPANLTGRHTIKLTFKIGAFEVNVEDTTIDLDEILKPMPQQRSGWLDLFGL